MILYFQFNQIDWKAKTSKRDTVLLIGVLSLLIGYSGFKVWKKNSELKSFKYSWAIIVDESRTNGEHFFYLEYIINDKRIKSSSVVVEGCHHKKNIGDTVVIKYSTINNETAKLKECYWNDNIKKEYGFYKPN